MENAIPYAASQDSTPKPQVVEALCKYPLRLSTEMQMFFPEQIPVIDVAELVRVQLLLTLEIAEIDISPSISIRIAGVLYTFYPSGMEQFTATYSFRAGSPPQLHCIAGGGVAPGSSSWQIIPAHYIEGSLPESGPVPFTVEGIWSNLRPLSVGMRLQLAPLQA